MSLVNCCCSCETLFSNPQLHGEYPNSFSCKSASRFTLHLKLVPVGADSSHDGHAPTAGCKMYVWAWLVDEPDEILGNKDVLRSNNAAGSDIDAGRREEKARTSNPPIIAGAVLQITNNSLVQPQVLRCQARNSAALSVVENTNIFTSCVGPTCHMKTELSKRKRFSFSMR